MKVTMLTLGSRGDVQPLIALGRALQQHGHQVRLATHPGFEASVREQGLDFAPLAEGDLGRGAETAGGRKWARDAGRTPAWVGFIRDARSVAGRRFADAAAACADADVVVASNLAQVIGWQLAEHRDVPLVRVLFHAPNYWMARSPRRPGVRIGRQLTWSIARPWLNRIRRDSVGLPKLQHGAPLMSGDRRVVLDLLPYPPSIFPPPDGRREIAEVTGYWFLDGTLDPEPPAGLAEFLEAGDAPVYVGFGTQADRDPVATTRKLVDGLRLAGRRGVIARTPEALAGVDLGSDVFAVQSVSHEWLFPRCAAVVHHCGTGTIAAALRAGVPTVAVPHFSDQFSWAKLLHEAGAGTAPISHRKLTAENLAEAIRTATAGDAMRRRAAELREIVIHEDGIANAVDAFQRRVAGAPAPQRAVREVAA